MMTTITNSGKIVLLAMLILMGMHDFCLAKTLYNGESTVCETTYKDANGNTCPNIQSVGAATGCITGGAPTVTTAGGRASVTINWRTNGRGKYTWNVVGECTPRQSSCSYVCKTRKKSKASQSELEHADSVIGFVDALDGLFAADNSLDVDNAIASVKTALDLVPFGPNYDQTRHGLATSELDELIATTSFFVIDTDIPVTLSLESLMDLDNLRVFGDDEIVPTVSEWGVMAMTLVMLTVGTVVVGRRRRPAAA